ncbi:hypothetical protein D3C86_1883320 [compost metagenome]
MGALPFGGAQLLRGGAHGVVVEALAAHFLDHACRAQLAAAAVGHGLRHAFRVDEILGFEFVQRGREVVAFGHMGRELAFEFQP